MCRSWYSPKFYILKSSYTLFECLYQHPWYLPLSYCCKITSCQAMTFYWIFANYRYSHMGKHLSTSGNSVTSDTIQLLVAIKGNYSGLFFFWKSRSKGEFSRDYLINIAPYLASSAWAIFYFGQVLVFCELINKNVLGWFLLIIMCKEHTLRRSTNLLRSRNHATLCLWLRREGPQMSNTS